MSNSNGALARHVKRLAHLDLAGAGQVYVHGHYCYVGHIPNPARLGTTILDIADPLHPRVVATITLDDPHSHSHKARVIGDVMIVNHERNNSGIGRKAEQLPALRARLREALGRDPSHAEIAAKMSLQESDIPKQLQAEGTIDLHVIVASRQKLFRHRLFQIDFEKVARGEQYPTASILPVCIRNGFGFCVCEELAFGFLR